MKLNPDEYDWHHIEGRPDSPYPIHHDMYILGYDLGAGTIDLLIRFDAEGGHCNAHRHIATTTVFVLRGEQHLTDLRSDGSRPTKSRLAGEYHLSTGDPHPHLERGGPEGAVVFFSHHTSDGRLYEIVDDSGNLVHTVTIESLVSSWESRERAAQPA